MKEKLFILTGPTAVGKTDLSIEIAKYFNGEIISADSMQIYKFMDIGTAKIKEHEMKGIPHHLIDIILPDEKFTVSNYKKLAMDKISEIDNAGKLPLLVGGTGLYINSLVYELDFASIAPNYSLRQKFEDLAMNFGNDYLHKYLSEVDLVSSHKINPNDIKRIIRALEIFETTGKPMSEQNKNFRDLNDKYQLSMICLNMDRAKLYERINTRVDIMIEKGLLEEVSSILNMGYDESLISLQAIGYKEIIQYFNNLCSLDEAIEKIKQGSRNYAKRQLTWFRRDNRIKWLDVDQFGNFPDLSSHIRDIIVNDLF